MVFLRDGTHFVGTLRTFDHFGSLVLQNTVQRFFVANKYHEKHIGVFLARGDSISMFGQIVRDEKKALFVRRAVFGPSLDSTCSFWSHALERRAVAAFYAWIDPSLVSMR